MKIMTWNNNSLGELDALVDNVLRERPELIAMQEVNQTAAAGQIEPELLEGQYPIPGCVTICRDNHAAQAALRLRQAGLDCSWVWIPVCQGDLTDGVAILSLGRKIRCVDRFPISREGEENRAVLGVQVEGLEDWFYTVQLSGFEDEVFLEQWKKLNGCLGIPRMYGPVWLMCSLQGTEAVLAESYAVIAATGWQDTHLLAADRTEDPLLRRDFIWCSHHRRIASSRAIQQGQRKNIALIAELSS